MADLIVGSIYNSPDANMGTLFRNTDGAFKEIANFKMEQFASRTRRVALQAGQPELGVATFGDPADTLMIGEFNTGRATTLGTLRDLPPGSDYIIGLFRGTTLPDFVLFKPGESKLVVKPVEQANAAQVTFGAGGTVGFDKPVQSVFMLPEAKVNKLLVLFGAGESAGIYKLDSPDKVTLLKTIEALGEPLSGALPVPNGFFMLTCPTNNKPSWRFQLLRRIERQRRLRPARVPGRHR